MNSKKIICTIFFISDGELKITSSNKKKKYIYIYIIYIKYIFLTLKPISELIAWVIKKSKSFTYTLLLFRIIYFFKQLNI